MAASSSSPSSGGHCKYHVFLSFRGEDTRKNFVCHLYRALEQKAIHTFIDSEELEKGNKISELLNAVDESRISVVVLSCQYATSTWCLKELVKIMECMDKKQQIVVPIFYGVDPSHIRKLKKKFGKAFAKHEQNPNLDKEALETWKTALKRVSDVSGWHSRECKDDIELIENIVGDVFKKLNKFPGLSSQPDNLVGMDHHIKEVNKRLCRGKNDVGVVGIWGMGGLGKTTIARAVYDKIAHQFEHKCFFYNVKGRFLEKDEAQMRGELLSMILKRNMHSVDIFNEGSNAILGRLGKKKVLVVLDDVETFFQIEALLGDFYSFGAGSRILVTTRDKESLAGVYETYEPMCLDHNESRELFMKYAFKKNQLSQEYSDLLERAIEHARGLPLALKVLGASLCDKNIHQWKQRLEKIKEIPPRKILDVLRTSLEGLDHQEKAIFLDIACLFRGWRKKFVTELLESLGFCALDGLSVLEDRALITDRFSRLDMHDLLQEMGREIVRLESPSDPGKRSRLWSCDDVSRVLTQNTGTDAVECLILDLSNSTVNLCIQTGAFIRMTKLRLLMIYYSFFNASEYDYFDLDYFNLDYFDADYDDYYCHKYDYGDYDCDGDIGSEYYFPTIRRCDRLCPVGGKQLWTEDLEYLSQELRFLVWHGCPLKSLPSTFNPTNLVQLDMRGSHIQQLWEGIKPLPNLKVIMLSHCQYLIKIPDLTEAINLQRLFFDGCSSLIEFEFHSSIYALQNLHVLDLKGCKQLKILPSCIHMKSLWILCLSGCSNLETFPEILEVMTKLKWLYLDGTAIKELSSSINNLTGLRVLNLKNCTELKTLPTSIHMCSLQTLSLNGCSNLEIFPEISGIMNRLFELLLDETAIKGLPSSINLLPEIRKLSMRNCKSLVFLPDSICNLAYLTHLDLQGCTELKTLPTSNHMRSLQALFLDGCSNLGKFPEISGIMKEVSELLLDETAIKGLPSSINLLPKIRKLSMRNCKSLVFLPDSICNLAYLTHLDLQDCTELKTLPTSIHMRSLQTLFLDGCSNLEKFPEISGLMKEVSELLLDETAIKGLPSSINLLPKIRKLSMRNCESLVFLPDSICNLAYLTHLDLQGCTELKTLPTSIHMRSLQTLFLDGCSNLEKFPEISGLMKEVSELLLDETAIKGLPSSIYLLPKIRKLSMRNCESLVFLPDSICNLAYLTHLDLQGCTELKTLPTSIHMRSLQALFLDGCSNLEKFPEISGLMKEVSELLLDETAIKGLPSSITLLSGIGKLSMRNCKSLESLPDSICNWALTHLDLTGCTELKTLPTSIDMSCLETLKLDGCSSLDKFPEISGIMKEQPKLPLDETAIKGLPSSIKEHCSYSALRHLGLSDCNLLELSDGITHLSSLRTLKLCRTNLESLPVTMNRLCCLTHLELEACKRLKSIPELSSSINYIDAHECTALETVSKLKPLPRGNNFFTFSNCLQLVQTNLFRDIVEKYADFQDNYRQPLRLNMCFPGSEVPDWFTHQSGGFSVRVPLLANWLDRSFLGFAICAVLKYQEVHHYPSPLSATCLCTFKGRSDDCSFSFDLLDSVFRIDRILQTDHMFQGYVSWSECHLIPEGKRVNETYTEATFQIESEFTTEQHRITSCGVHFVYAPSVCGQLWDWSCPLSTPVK